MYCSVTIYIGLGTPNPENRKMWEALDRSFPYEGSRSVYRAMHGLSSAVSCCVLLQACARQSACLPSRSRLQRVSTLHGMQEHLVVEECGCWHKPNRCYRQAHTLQLYPGTPYETHLDVGSCSGRCESGELIGRATYGSP
jgi:hypothetical protein